MCCHVIPRPRAEESPQPQIYRDLSVLCDIIIIQRATLQNFFVPQFLSLYFGPTTVSTVVARVYIEAL